MWISTHPIRHLLRFFIYFLLAFTWAYFIPFNNETAVFFSAIPLLLLVWLGARSGRIGLRKYRREKAVLKAWKELSKES